MKRQRHRWKFNLSAGGYVLLTAVIAVNIFAILILKARTMWETGIRRDLEQELVFRGKQYVTAIEMYKKKHTNLPPRDLDILYEEKFLRKRFKDPMTESGTWNIVMRGGKAGARSTLLIVPEELVPQYINRAMIVGVCSTSPEEGFLEYRKKKKYNEWAFYLGEQVNKEMPELKYVDESGEEEEQKERGIGERERSGRDGRERE